MSALSAVKKPVVIWVAIAVVVIIAGLSLFSTINSLRDQGIKRENALEAQYQDNQNELSTYILKIKEILGVADRGANKLDQILSDAIKGRYDGKMEPGTGGAMFSAITEAYPDLTATSASYAKVQDAIMSGRDAYKNKQTQLLAKIESYENWTTQGLIDSQIIKSLGFPTDSLEARVGEKVYKGAEALEQMKNIVKVKEATTAYETGETAPLIEPETTK